MVSLTIVTAARVRADLVDHLVLGILVVPAILMVLLVLGILMVQLISVTILVIAILKIGRQKLLCLPGSLVCKI
jgi:hypothetical protein